MTDDDLRRAQLRAVRERLSDEMTSEAGSLAAYIEFTDALTAAGLSRALGDDPTPDLRHAGRAGLVVFQTRGSQDVVVTDLDTGETSRKPDTSAANPTTMVQALLAALASGDARTAAQLARIPTADLESDQAPATPVVRAVAAALQDAAAGDRAALRSRVARGTPEDSTYGEMLRQLGRWARGDAVDVEALRRADRTSRRQAGSPVDDLMAVLGLPELGLAALEGLEA